MNQAEANERSCYHCGIKLPNPHLECDGCLVVYCSDGCHSAAIAYHEPYCDHIRTGGSSSKNLELAEYHDRVAKHDPNAWSLLNNLRLTDSGQKTDEDVQKPLKRLILTGKDTPENLKLFFGKNFTESPRLETLHRIARKEINWQIHTFPEDYYCSASYYVDGTECVPREPTPSDAMELVRIKSMQGAIQRYQRSKDGPVSEHDLRNVLEVEKIPLDEQNIEDITIAFRAITKAA